MHTVTPFPIRISETIPHRRKCVVQNATSTSFILNQLMTPLVIICVLISQKTADGFTSALSRKRSTSFVIKRPARRFVVFSTVADEQNGIVSIDPILFNAIKEQKSIFSSGFNLLATSKGIQVWKGSLTKGRFPMEEDFTDKIWPAEPFYSKIVDAMTILELPRFALKHPETLSTILLTLLRLTFQFLNEIRVKEEEKENDAELDDDVDNYRLGQDQIKMLQTESNDKFSLSLEEIDELALEIANSFTEEWNGVVSGVNLLDQLFGYDHDLLDIEDEEDVSGNTAGFGLEDGIWKHTGWREIPALQKQIASMQELKNLMKEIGRRPTAKNSDEVKKFSPRTLQKDGAMGAQFDPQTRESVSGISLSGSLTEMLPSEALLLRGSSGALRSLFMAKKMENKLLSYEMSGWEDVPSIPLRNPPYLKRMPSAPGGPIIVCLDTSWSMSGMREQLSKAVVLACVSTAHKQRRDCQIVAFSTEHGIIEAGVITPDGAGIQRLLDFLSHSFGGGTDVTGALRFAMETLDSDIMTAADILMISDGEIPNPPVSNQIMDALDRLKLRRGVKIHGLLVGKKESEPLSRLCTDMHNFLLRYDTLETSLGGLQGTSTTLQLTPLRPTSVIERRGTFGFTRRIGQRPLGSALKAKYSKKKKGKNKWSDYDYGGDEDDDRDIMQSSWWNEEDERDGYDDAGASRMNDQFHIEVKDFTNALRLAVGEDLDRSAWKAEILSNERNEKGSCWETQKEVKAAIEIVNTGLVERHEEARLVVLAMLSMEHILLLGVPGTGKSILGRRLSKLCDGAFFQRLLTKFSTPEELFGPLSLKSLENDEYRRCTAGFLPTASVAFLDEIFKSNSAILNTLLTILNERKFDNGEGQEDCPIRCVVGASNEMPESDELGALFDRFLIRKEVLPVSDEGVLDLLSIPNSGSNVCERDDSCGAVFAEGLDDAISALSNAADSVHLVKDESELIRDLRTFMREAHSVEISDRRLVKTARLLKLSAASHGRKRVDLIDCLLLQHCMWHHPDQKVVVRDWLWENITPGKTIEQFRVLLDTLRGEVIGAIRKTSGDVSGHFGGHEHDIDVIETLRSELSSIICILENQQSDLLRHIELLRDANNFLWLDPDDSKSAQQLLLPKGENVLEEVNILLTDAHCLQICIAKSNVKGPRNELRLSVVENIWEEGYRPEIIFTEQEMGMGMKEAKKKYDLETFRKWKRARKRFDK